MLRSTILTRMVHQYTAPPQTKRILYKPDLSKLKRLEKERERRRVLLPKVETQCKHRVNGLDIQMLPQELHEQVFKNYPTHVYYDHELIEACKRDLIKNGMVAKDAVLIEEVKLKLPPLEGKDLEEHFQTIGQQQAGPYLELVERLLKQLPKKPNNWFFKEGWTRYSPDSPPESVEYPLEEDLIFDVEVCMSCGKAPTLATAVSSKAWYGWISKQLFDGGAIKPATSHQYHEDNLIPLESVMGKSSEGLEEHLRKPKVVIGHNVSFDRAKIREQYWLERTGTRFVDTMSLHVCVSGMTSYQRAMMKSKKENPDDDSWKSITSLNSLTEVHNLYCGKQIAKETRNVFIVGTIADVQNEFQNVMNYCSDDVLATHRVLKKLFPMFRKRFPHPVTFAGMLELSTAYLPVNDNWVRYLEDSEQTYEDLDTEGRILLAKRADQACQLLHDDKYKEDLWLWDQNWSVRQLKPTKSKKTTKSVIEAKHDVKTDEDYVYERLEEKFKYFKNMKTSTRVILPGYPKWYRNLCERADGGYEWIPGAHLISTGMQITPKLLNLTWEGYPLHYIRGLGWGFMVPFNPDCEGVELPLKQLLEKCPIPQIEKSGGSSYHPNIGQTVQDHLAKKDYYSKVKQDQTNGVYKGTGVWCNTLLEDSVFFFKLPHKDGASSRVGNPLAKDFLNKFSENVLAGDTESAEQVLAIARNLSYWRNNKNRIMEQMVVWLNNTTLPKHLKKSNYGAIIPEVVVCGTLTRRAVEATWMTASNAQKERIGSELRGMIQAPAGYKIVGADVDSQELWIASVIGDASYAKTHGATPFGWMTLSGSKADSTDMHSVTAKAVGISRDHAKVINYARIYGAGQNFAEQLLKQFNPQMSETEARGKAKKMFDLTKGKRVYQLRKEHIHDLADVPYNKWQAFEICKAYGKSLNEMFYRPKWVGGTESAMFNSLERIAGELSPVTPFLKCRLSRALEPTNLADDRFLPTRVNWVVQSGAVDFLHLMLVCMRWLTAGKARFCLSFHDEVRYLVPDEFRYDVALAMHTTNLLTRAFCSIQLGIYDLPSSVAFFSSVEIDQVLRKDAKQDCKTPSNPHGLEKGYGIPNGESLDIYETIKKITGEKKNWYLEAR